MEWGNVSPSNTYTNCSEGEGMMGAGVLCVKVMTDEQMEILRRQISIYDTICQQLVEMHRTITAHQDSIAGMSMGSLYCDPLMMSGGGPKITARQRWTPTPMQLQILETIFAQGNGNPSKKNIKEIASELCQHGQISETNVYNWFQNRRARSKRKQIAKAALRSTTESEVEVEIGCSKETKGKSENINSFRSPEVSSEVHSIDPEAKRISNDSSKSSSSLGQMPSYENGLSNPRMVHLMGKKEISGGFRSFWQGESYDMIG